MKKKLIISIALLFPLYIMGQQKVTSKQKKSNNSSISVNTAENYYKKGKAFFDQKKYADAKIWYEKAAEKNYAPAFYGLGVMYGPGYSYGVNKDFAKAFELYSKAANQGYPPAQYELSDMYNSGYYVQKAKIKAFEWMEKAANLGYVYAQRGLASKYEGGYGVTQDYVEAFDWYLKAANQNDEYSQYKIGTMYEKGFGVTQNYQLAKEWYQKAIKNRKSEVYSYFNDALERVEKLISEQPIISNADSQNTKNVTQTKNQANSVFAQGTSSNTPRQQTVTTTIVMPDVDKDIPLTTVKNPNLLAVIIGNENYRKLPDVPYAENDAKMFKEYCEKTLGVTKEHIRYLPNAGLVDIYDARDWLKTGAESYGNDASVIFYYAGHGLPNRETGLPYILPVEVDGSNLKLAVSLQELYDEFGKLPARSVTVFLDACFTGVDRDNNVVASREGERLAFKMSPKIPTPTGKTVIFSATENNQTAHPFKDRKHGFFTYFLLRKLQESKGDATLGEIADFVSNGVRRAVFDKIQTSQTPSVKPSGNFANDWRQMKLK